jgi:hypothetical protein
MRNPIAITSLFETHPTVRDLDRSSAFHRDIVGLQPAAHDAVLGAASSGSARPDGHARVRSPRQMWPISMCLARRQRWRHIGRESLHRQEGGKLVARHDCSFVAANTIEVTNQQTATKIAIIEAQPTMSTA